MQTRQRTNTVSEELVSFSIFAGKTFVHARACVEDPRFLYFLGVILLIVYFRLSSLCCDKLTFGRQGKSSLSRASSGDTLHYMLHDSASTTPHHRLQFRTDKPLRPQGEVKTQAIALQNLDHLWRKRHSFVVQTEHFVQKGLSVWSVFIVWKSCVFVCIFVRVRLCVISFELFPVQTNRVWKIKQENRRRPSVFLGNFVSYSPKIPENLLPLVDKRTGHYFQRRENGGKYRLHADECLTLVWHGSHNFRWV